MSAYDDRDNKGRFAKGNHSGLGNPFARQAASLRARLLSRLSQADLDEIADNLIVMAKMRDLAAIKLLFQYTMGKPIDQPHPDRIDADELEALRANTMTGEAAQQVMTALPARPVLELASLNITHQGDLFYQELKAGMATQLEQQATVNSRTNQGQAKPIEAKPAVGFVETETLRLVTLDDAAKSPPEPHAANRRRS